MSDDWGNKFFEALRHDKRHHLGLGDVRLTIGQQEEILQRIVNLQEADAHQRAEIQRLEDELVRITDGLEFLSEAHEWGEGVSGKFARELLAGKRANEL